MLPCYTLQPTQRHSFLRNELPSLMNLVSVLQHLIKSAQCVIAGLKKKLMVRKGRNWRNYSYLISLSFSSTDSQGLRSSLNSRSSRNKPRSHLRTQRNLYVLYHQKKNCFRLRTLHETPSHPPKRNWNGKWLLAETVRSNSHIALAN